MCILTGVRPSPFFLFLQTGANSFEYTSFERPESITFLSIDQCDDIMDLDPFTRLSVLVCNWFDHFDRLVLPSLISGQAEHSSQFLNQLTQLHLNVKTFLNVSGVPDDDDVELLGRLYRSLKSSDNLQENIALDQMNQLRIGFRSGDFHLPRIRPGLQIYLNGIRLDLKKEFESYSFHYPLMSVYLHNELVNQLDVEPNRTVHSASYVELRNLFGPEKAQSFQQLAEYFPSLCSVSVVREAIDLLVFEPDVLMEFLKACKAFIGLQFEHSCLLTSFYDEMVLLHCCRTLSYLVIIECDMFNHRFDFEFVAKLPSLTFFQTNMAPRVQMLCLLAKMRPAQRFVFDFDCQDMQFYLRFCFERTLSHWKMWEGILESAYPVWERLRFVNRSWVWLLEYFHTSTASSQLIHWIQILPDQAESWIAARNRQMTNGEP